MTTHRDFKIPSPCLSGAVPYHGHILQKAEKGSGVVVVLSSEEVEQWRDRSRREKERFALMEAAEKRAREKKKRTAEERLAELIRLAGMRTRHSTVNTPTVGIPVPRGGGWRDIPQLPNLQDK